MGLFAVHHGRRKFLGCRKAAEKFWWVKKKRKRKKSGFTAKCLNPNNIGCVSRCRKVLVCKKILGSTKFLGCRKFLVGRN